MQLSELLSELERRPKFKHGLAASPEQLKTIEEALNVQLPDQFRVFLQTFGFAIWRGHAIYGIYELGSILSPSFDFDIVRQTLKHRQLAVPAPFASVALDGVVIKKYEGGGFYFLFGQDVPRAGEVVLFEFHDDSSEAERWADFASFLAYLLALDTK